MAELLGVVAGGAGLASLAVQLLDSAEKLRRFYKASQTAPQMIGEVIFDLETLSCSLRHLEMLRLRDNTDDELLERCIVACRTKTAQICEIVARAEIRLRKHERLGKLYSALKEPEIYKLMEKLEQSKSSLMFAYSMYCQSRSTRESVNYFSQTTVVTGSKQNMIDSDTSVSASNRDSRASHSSDLTSVKPFRRMDRRAASRKRWQVKLTFPLQARTWVIACELDIALHLQIRPLNIRPGNTKAFEHVRHGDIAAVQQSLTSGELSPWDYDQSGNSILDLAAASRDTDLFKMLLAEGPHLRDTSVLIKALEMALTADVWGMRKPQESSGAFFQSLFTMLVDTYGLDVDLYPGHNLLTSRLGALSGPMFQDQPFQPYIRECIRICVLNQSVPPGKSSFHERFCIGMSSCWRPTQFMQFIRESDIQNQCAFERDSNGRTALHWLASQWARTDPWAWGDNAEYEDVMLELLAKGSDLTALDHAGKTPLWTLLHGHNPTVWHDHHGWAVAQDVMHAVRNWTRIIQASGRSLQSYVACEQRKFAPLSVTSFRRGAGTETPPVLDIDHYSYDVQRSCMIVEGHFDIALEVRQLQPVPGDFPRNERVPRQIVWDPNRADREEGRWVKRRTIRIPGPRKVLNDVVDRHDRFAFDGQNERTSYGFYLGRPHDDHGPFHLMRHARSTKHDTLGHTQNRKRRASSLPPSLSRPNSTIIVDWAPLVHRCHYCRGWSYADESARYDPSDPNGITRYCACNQCHGWSETLKSLHWAEFSWEAEFIRHPPRRDLADRFIGRFWSDPDCWLHKLWRRGCGCETCDPWRDQRSQTLPYAQDPFDFEQTLWTMVNGSTDA